MTIGSRIKARRKELGISVDDIAATLGKNRATIYRYESNEIENLPTTILEPLAKILQTTPAYLMGWDDLIDSENSDAVHTSEGIHKSFHTDRDDSQAKMNVDLKNNADYQDTTIDNPDIRMIARAGKKMTPEQAENLRKYAEFMFPEAFNDKKREK